MIFDLQANVMLVVLFTLLAVKIFAFVNSLLYSSEAYQAAGKLTKPAWTLILGLAVALELLGFVGFSLLFINLALTIAALVYLADVRPALVGLHRR